MWYEIWVYNSSSASGVACLVYGVLHTLLTFFTECFVCMPPGILKNTNEQRVEHKRLALVSAICGGLPTWCIKKASFKPMHTYSISHSFFQVPSGACNWFGWLYSRDGYPTLSLLLPGLHPCQNGLNGQLPFIPTQYTILPHFMKPF